MKAAEPELTNNNYKLEMNVLVDSDPEDYQADLDMTPPRRHATTAEFLSDSSEWFGRRETSLQASRERLECAKKRKAEGVKLNNSFTGPYP
jgi:hypothetical protein